jgi:hypothetical protein
MQTINAQTIINQVNILALNAPDERSDYATPASTPLAYIKIQTSQRGHVNIINDKKHLAAFAAKVRKNAAAFGGGLIRTSKARPSITWPAGPVKLVAEMLEDGQQGEAAALAIRKCGALFFNHGRAPFMAWAPQSVEGLPNCLASVRCTEASNKWQVIHLETGRKLGRNCATRKAAEASATNDWLHILSEEQRAKVPAMVKDHSAEDARSQYLAAAGITTAEDLQADPAPATKVQKPKTEFSKRVAFAAKHMLAGNKSTRAFDSCFESWDGDAVAAAIYSETLKNENLSAVAWRLLSIHSAKSAFEKCPFGLDFQAWSDALVSAAPTLESFAEAQAAALIESASEAAAVAAIATTEAEEQPQAEELAAVAAMAEGDSHQTGRALIGRVAPAQVDRGQVITSKSGNWSAVFFNCPKSGLPSMRFMHSDEDGRGQEAGRYETGRERMADLQRKAKAADNAAAQRADAAKEATKPAALSITLERLEGPSEECDKPQTVASFEDADNILMAWSATAPDNGCYNKTRACVTWPDGTEYSFRLDLVHHSKEVPSLRSEIASTAEFWTGKRCPDHMTGEQYAATVARCSESDAAFYAHLLELLAKSGHFSKSQPMHFADMLQFIEHLNIQAAGLVGFGVSTYSPDAGKTKNGAITSAEKLTRWGEELKIVVTYEDGTTNHLDARGFAEKTSQRAARHRLDGCMHGAPYLAQLAAAVASKNAAETSAKAQAEKARAQAVQRLVAEYPHLMTWEKAKESGRKMSGHTMAAHNIRLMLKSAFPCVKFSVKSDSFSMGNSVGVSWVDGPTAAEVETITGKFSGGKFDGMDDSYTHTSSPWTDLFGSSKYVNTSRSLSDAAILEIMASIYPDEATRPSLEDYHAGRVRDEHGRSPIYMASHTWTASKAKA